MPALRTLHLDTERTWRGGEQQALLLARGLADLGHVVAIAARRGSEISRRASEAGIAVHEGPLGGELNPAAVLFVAKLAKRGSFDLIHAHTSHAHAIGAIAARLAGIPCIVSRRVDFAIRRGVLGLNLLKYRRGVAAYVAISEAVRGVLIEAGVDPTRIRLVPSGIDPRRHQHADPSAIGRELGFDDGVPVIGAVGHFAWHKGLETLIDAAPRVLEAAPRARFVLLGDGELREALEARAAAVVGKERVERGTFLFPGFRPDVASFFSRFDVVAAPSLLEGLNTSILDALALARPVVASRVGGIPEAVIDDVTGLLVPPGDPPALAAAIVRLLGDRSLAQRLGDAGRARVLERFTAAAMVEGTLEVYREVLAGRGSTAAQG